MNSYLFVDTYKRLLMPHSIQHFSTLQNMDLDHMNILFVNDTRCLAYAQKNSKILTELNQILISKNLQLKQITLEQTTNTNLNSFNYILSCQEIMKPILDKNFEFTKKESFADNAFQLYENNLRAP